LRRDDPSRILPRLSLALLGLAAAAAAGAAPLDTLRACAAQADGQERGLAAFERNCPGLVAALRDLGYITGAGADWQGRLTATGLRDLAALAQRYEGAMPGRAPDLKPLDGIVAGLTPVDGAARSWWDTTRGWLRSWFERQDESSLRRLGHLFAKINTAAGIAGWLAAGLLVAVLAAAAAYTVAELRTLGVLPRRRGTALQGAAAPAVIGRPAPGDSPPLDAAQPADQPAILLRLLVQALSRRGRLAAAAHLTHRELAGRAVLEDAEQRARFSRVARAAELLLYGPPPRSLGHVTEVVEEGRELLSQIERQDSAV
jgi:hypothetical protein